jgi:hypothetical protein
VFGSVLEIPPHVVAGFGTKMGGKFQEPNKTHSVHSAIMVYYSQILRFLFRSKIYSVPPILHTGVDSHH